MDDEAFRNFRGHLDSKDIIGQTCWLLKPAAWFRLVCWDEREREGEGLGEGGKERGREVVSNVLWPRRGILFPMKLSIPSRVTG
jgi:hypothetical protein